MTTLPYNPDPYNTPDVAVSPLSFQTYFPAKSPKKGTWMELWFGSGSHLDPGYKSADPAAVAKQVATVLRRGFDFIALNWYGPNVQPQHSATLLLKAECEKQGLQFIIGLDKGTWTFGMPSGADPTAYGLSVMQYMAANFFSSPAYIKHSDGRNVLAVWDCAAVAGLDVAKVFGSVPNVAVLFDKATGVSKPASSGCFGWIGIPDIGAYQADFLASVTKSKAANPKLIVMASLCKGFDDHGRRPGLDPTKSCWKQADDYRFVDEKQGQQWLDRVAALNAHMLAHPGVVDYILVVTHNDYEENTATERGIDSELTVSLSVAKGVLTATLNGNLNTVDHVEFLVYDGTTHLIFSAPANAATFDLNSLNPANGLVYAAAANVVGKPLFQNKASNVVSTTVTIIPPQTRQFLYSGTVPIPVPPSIDVAIDTVSDGLKVTGTRSIGIDPQQSITVKDQPVTVTITEKKTIWS